MEPTPPRSPGPGTRAWIPGPGAGERQLQCQCAEAGRLGSAALARGPCGCGREPAAQPHLSRRGPWGGVSHLCWSLVRFLTSPRGRVQSKWALASEESPPSLWPACQGSGQTGKTCAKGRGQLGASRPLQAGRGGWGAPSGPRGSSCPVQPPPPPLLTQAPPWWERGACPKPKCPRTPHHYSTRGPPPVISQGSFSPDVVPSVQMCEVGGVMSWFCFL